MTPDEVTELVAALNKVSIAVSSASSGVQLETGIGWILAIIVAVIGATIAGGYVKKGGIIADERAKKAGVEKERQEIENLRKALLTEIVALSSGYQRDVGSVLEDAPNDQPFNMIFPTNQRYFVIYEENAHLIGKVPDDQERELIVITYTRAKGLLDSFHLNNTMTEKRNYAVGLGPALLGMIAQPVIDEINRTMANYTPVLKKQHYDTIEALNELRESLSNPIEWS